MTENSTGYVPVEAKWTAGLDCDRPTARELQVLTLAVNGMDNEQIATQLGIKPATVKQTIIKVNDKLRCYDGIGERLNNYAKRREIIQLLIDQGFFAPEKQG